MPIPGGYIKIIAKNGDISVYVEGKQVRKVYTTKEINVVGAEKFIWTFPQEMDISYSLVPKKEILPFKTGKYAQFFDSEFHVNPIEFIKDKIDIEGLARISHTDILFLFSYRQILFPIYNPALFSENTGTIFIILFIYTSTIENNITASCNILF